MLSRKKLKFVKHSQNKKNLKDCDIYIVDRYGETSVLLPLNIERQNEIILKE